MKYTYKGQTYDCPDRDNRRQKCYDGERAAFGAEFSELLDDGDFKSACAFANHVLRSATWMRLRKDHNRLRHDGTCWIRERGEFEISDGRGTTYARGGGNHLNLPRWARTKPVILHEIAHCLVGANAGHNWPFNRAFIDLVNVFMGRSYGTKLERALKAEGAKTKPRRIIPPERLAALRERGRMLAQLAAKRREESK